VFTNPTLDHAGMQVAPAATMLRTALLALLSLHAGCNGGSCPAAENEGAWCGGSDSEPPPQIRFDSLGVVPNGDAFTIAVSRHEFQDDDTVIPDRIEMSSLTADGVVPLGPLQFAGAPLEASGATLASDSRGPLLAWIDKRDFKLHAGRLVADTEIDASAALGPAAPQHPVVVPADAGFLVAWRPNTSAPLNLQRLDANVAVHAELIEIDRPRVELGTDGTDYLATWIEYGSGPLDPQQIIARRIPAVGAPSADLVVIADEWIHWISPIARTANGYRLFYSGSLADGIDFTWDVRIDSDGTVSRMRVPDDDAYALARIGGLVYAGGNHLVVSEVGSINFEEIELRVIADGGEIVKGPSTLERKSETHLDVAVNAHGFAIVYEAPVGDQYSVRTARVDSALAIEEPTTIGEDWVGSRGCSAGGGSGPALVLVLLLLVFGRARATRAG
jgi:hypothetical protein